MRISIRVDHATPSEVGGAFKPYATQRPL